MKTKMSGWLFAMAALALSIDSIPAAAEDNAVAGRPTFYKDVLPILQENCQACHRPSGANLGGMIAPMSFMTYAEVRPWARAIAREVASKAMPPWDASEQFHGVFENEATLTAGQIETIVRWSKTGAVPGAKADAPAPMTFPESGWAIGKPDLVVDMGEDFVVSDDIEDQYYNFTVEIPESVLPESRWVKALEFRPGSEVVHHIIGYVITPGSGDHDGVRHMIGGIAPGNDPDTFPDGFGYLVEPNSKLVFAMHYHKESGAGTAVADRSALGLKFYDAEKEVRPLIIEAIGNGDFEIPAGHPRWEVGAAKTYGTGIQVLNYLPHMHLRGVAASYTAYLPDGTVEPLVDVPNYDFNWQRSYQYKEMKALPAQTRIEVTMMFDNSDERAAEIGFNSKRDVRFGGPTTDEMALGWLTYAPDGTSARTAVAAVAQD